MSKAPVGRCPQVPQVGAVALTCGQHPEGVRAALPGSVPNKTVKKIEWSFSVGAGATIQVAEFGPGGFKRPDPKDQFKDQLEMFNKTALKIRALEHGDSGVYGAWIKLYPAVVENQSFNLSVYRLVPVPGIQHQLLSLTIQGCKVTLWCWVPAGSDAEAVWQLSSSPRMPWGQFCEDSQTLCLAVPASTFNSSYTCMARNPIQKKNTSIRLDTLWTPDWWRWHMCLGLLAMGVGALLSIIWLRRKKRRKKAAKGGGRCWVKAMSSQPGFILSMPAPGGLCPHPTSHGGTRLCPSSDCPHFVPKQHSWSSRTGPTEPP
uniref:SLAM family member 8 n=1 Tax=Accipiter nisus TaxID=211598 RepID=A0A8B9NN48_9AVES